MTLSLNNLTFIIVTFKSNHIIDECIESLPKNSNIIIIENSNNIELKKTLPKKLILPPITSRIVVLETNFLELESILSKNQLETKKRDIITEKSLESYHNLIYQINKTIEKELQKITE